MNRTLCLELEKDKSINPLTSRVIDPTKGVFKRLANECFDLGINVRTRRGRSSSRERQSPAPRRQSPRRQSPPPTRRGRSSSRERQSPPPRRQSPRRQSPAPRRQQTPQVVQRKSPTPPRTLARHQIKVIEFMKKPENNAILMVHSAGAGKTFTTVNAVVELQKLKPNVHVTIIAPKPDLITWQLECLRFKIKNVDYISFAYLANNPTEFFRLCQDGIVIIDEVHNLRSEIERFHYSKTRIVKFLKSKNFSEEIIGDLFANFQVEELVEMTKIPKELVFTPIDGASAYFDGSCAMFSWKMFLLTSTPVVNSHTDLNNIIKMLSRGTIPPLADETTLSRTDETLSQLPISYFNAEKTKITGFPDYIFEDVLVELTPKQRMKYDQIYEGPQYKEQWFKGVPLLGILTSILSGGGNVELGAYYSPKLNFIKDVLLEEKTKSVIYSKWLGKGMEQALDFFKRAIPELADLEGRIMGVTGRTPNADQAKIIKEFNKDESFKILIISGISPREGLNLKGTLKGTRNMFLLEPGWDSAAEAQALPIAIRYQSHSHLPYKQQNCHVYRLLNDDTIDVVLQKTFVERKKKITDVIAQILKKYSI